MNTRNYKYIYCLKIVWIFFLDGGNETEATMQMQGEDERRKENTAAWEEETTFTNTEVSNNLSNGHQISASVPQMSSPGASTSSDVVINVDQE